MTDDIQLQRTPVHRALLRPNLLMGADRELVLVSGLAAAILIFVVLTVYSVVFGLMIWLLVFAALRQMAKADPFMRQVYLRHVAFKAAYGAKRSAWHRA